LDLCKRMEGGRSESSTESHGGENRAVVAVAYRDEKSQRGGAANIRRRPYIGACLRVVMMRLG
jgi:hypothetical protein